MHLGHVGPPGDNGIGQFDVVVAARGFVDPEGLHKPGNGGRHAVAGVGVQVVGSEAGFHQLGHRVPFLNCVLAGTEDADAGGAQLAVSGFKRPLHLVKSALP